MMKRLILLSVALLVLTGIGYRYLADSTKAVETAVVQNDDISSSISISGKVVADREINVMPRISGQVMEVPAKQNERVGKGQPLVRLDARAAQVQLDEAEAEVRKAESEQALAAREYRNLRRLLDAGGASRLQVANQRSKLDMSRAQLGAALAALKSARLQRDYTLVTAPFDAIVLDVSARAGVSVTPSTSLLKLADAGQREVELAVDAGDIADIHPQQAVELTVDALPGEKWRAAVLRIAPAVDSSKQGNTVAVRTSLPEDAPLKLGQQVDARVITAEKSAVPVVPFSAVRHTDDGGEEVAVVSNGVVHWRKITTGIEDLSRVEVVSGVQAGEAVVLDPPDGLQEGERVKSGAKP